MELNASIFDELLLLSFGWARRHGFWNQVVKAAFRILNSVVSGTFCRSPARSKSPNASVSFLQHIEINNFICQCSRQMVKQQAPRSRAQAEAHLAHALLM
jgi:hypothetical protein